MSQLPFADLDGAARSLSTEELDAFRARHRGACLTPSDDGYGDARVIWNGSIEAQPAIIVQPTGVADVVEAVRFAGEHRMLTAIRGGGHNVAGNALAHRGIVIDMRAFRSVLVDAKARRAWVGGGCTLGDVDRETQVHGLAAPLGVVSQTGVAGLTLCGGYGWLRRRFGLASDSVRAFEVVTPDGRVVRASEEQNEDLYWALRGGGGNFGVVTGFEFELYPVGPEVVHVGIAYPIEETRAILAAWREFMSSSPPEFASNFNLWTLPDVEAFPEEARDKPVCLIAGCWTGPIEEGLEFLAPLRSLSEAVIDITSPMTWCESQSMLDPFFDPGIRRNYWKSIYLERFDDEVLDFIVERAIERPDPWALVAIWHLDGAAAEVAPDATPMGNREAPYLFSLDTGWVDPSKDERCISWTRDLWNDMHRYSKAGGCYLNFPGQGEEGDRLMRASLGDENYERLCQIKSTWDPANQFRLNQNVKPRR